MKVIIGLGIIAVVVLAIVIWGCCAAAAAIDQWEEDELGIRRS